MAAFGRSGGTGIAAALALLTTVVGGLCQPAFSQATVPADPTLESAERLIRRAVSAAKSGPLTQSPEASQVIAALRTSRDKDLIPIFDKIRQSKSIENQIYSMVAAAILERGGAGGGGGGDTAAADSDRSLPEGPSPHLDLKILFSCKDAKLVGSAVASLIDAQALSADELKRIMLEAPDAAHRAMAAGELNRLGKLTDRAPLKELLKDENNIVRYYAATTMLSGKDAAEVAAGLAALKEMSGEHDIREAPVQALMLVRVQKEKLASAIPWAAQIAADEAFDEGLRYTAVSTLLSLGAPEGAQILDSMIQKQHDAIQQVKLGLISLDHPTMLKASMLRPLADSKSRLAKAIGTLAQRAAGNSDITHDLVTLLKEGDPIVLDWTLSYSDRLEQDHRVELRTALVNQATIVDNVRERDYECAALATERMLNSDGALGRKTVAGLLQSDNRAVVEAVLAGIYRSTAKDQSELVMPVWTGLTKTTSAETAANYAALILVREGHKEPLTWLPGMVVGGTVQGPGFRALASWYYAKLKGQADALIKDAISDEDMSMVTADSIRQFLASADCVRDPYRVAEAAAALLDSNPRDNLAADYYRRALVSLRLTAVIERWETGSEVVPAQRAAGGGLIPWSSRARRFAANLHALELRNAKAASLIADSVPALTGYELYQGIDGNYQVSDIQKAIPASWLGTLANHKGANSLWRFDRSQTPLPPPVAFDGAGFGWLLQHVLETTRHSYLNYSCAVYVLENDPISLAMLFHMHDLRSMIEEGGTGAGSGRLRWCVGNDAQSVLRDLREALLTNDHWTIPAQFARCGLRPRPALDPQSAVRSVLETRNNQHKQHLETIAQTYRGKDAAYWHRRFESATGASGDPLRILGITSRYTTVLQHSMSELKSAVDHIASASADTANNGSAGQGPSCIMEIALEPDDQSVENPFVEKIASFKPDLIVQISRMRYENPNLPGGVPFLTWDQDNLPCMRTPEATASLNDLTFVAGHGALQGYLYNRWPERNVIFCHLAAATHRYQPRAITPAETAKYDCDLSYVSNASASPMSLRDQHLSRYQGGAGDAATLFVALCEQILAHSLDPQGTPWNDSSLRASASQIILDRRLNIQPGILQEIILSALLVADRAFRHETLKWVSDYCQSAGKSLRIYGAGWETHPTLSRHAAGPAQQGAEIQAITLASRINLQIIGTGVLHSRFLDGIAAGGFFLFRQTPNERGESQFLADLECVSRFVFDNAAESFAALDQASDPGVQKAWQAIRSAYVTQMGRTGLDEQTTLRGLATAHQLRNPLSLIPQLNEIAFATSAGLASKATSFLANASLREQLAATLRESVQRHFSYDTRLQAFLTHIREALRQSSPAK